MFLCCLVMVPEANATLADMNVLGTIANEAGSVIGVAAACSENTQSNAARLLGEVRDAIDHADGTSGEREHMEVLFESSISDGRIAETLNFPACSAVESRLADLEHALFGGEAGGTDVGVAAVTK
jgi:hypothetical protein